MTKSNTTKVLKAMANASRLDVLNQLAKGDKTVTEINHQVSLSQSALSQHLRVLRKAGLVATRRDSQRIFYSLSVTGRQAVAAGQFLARALE